MYIVGNYVIKHGLCNPASFGKLSGKVLFTSIYFLEPTGWDVKCLGLN